MRCLFACKLGRSIGVALLQADGEGTWVRLHKLLDGAPLVEAERDDLRGFCISRLRSLAAVCNRGGAAAIC